MHYTIAMSSTLQHTQQSYHRSERVYEKTGSNTLAKTKIWQSKSNRTSRRHSTETKKAELRAGMFPDTYLRKSDRITNRSSIGTTHKRNRSHATYSSSSLYWLNQLIGWTILYKTIHFAENHVTITEFYSRNPQSNQEPIETTTKNKLPIITTRVFRSSRQHYRSVDRKSANPGRSSVQENNITRVKELKIPRGEHDCRTAGRSQSEDRRKLGSGHSYGSK